MGHIFLAIVLGVVGVFFWPAASKHTRTTLAGSVGSRSVLDSPPAQFSCSLLSSQNVTSTGLNYSPGQSRSRPNTTRRGSGSPLPGRPGEPVKPARQPSCRVRSCEDFRTPADNERFHTLGWPAFENLQRTKPRGMIRGRAATTYGDLMAVRGGIRVAVACSTAAWVIDDGDDAELDVRD